MILDCAGDGRELSLWFKPPRNCRVRKEPARFVVWHTTGGEGGAKRVHDTLMLRGLSIHFTVDHDGKIVQQADLDTVTFHAGKHNAHSIGIEVRNKLLAPPHAKTPRDAFLGTVHGREFRFLALSTAALESCRVLRDELSRRLSIPRATCRELRVLTAEEIEAFRGHLGHLHLTTRKIDPGPELLRWLASG